jgi:ABC-2 type transport system permease protein
VRRVRAVVFKDWAEVFKNRMVLGTVAFLPLALTAIPLAVLAVTTNLELDAAGTSEMPDAFVRGCDGLTDVECGQYFLTSQFMLLFMILPLAIPITFASYSIIGEKTTRTLEPVLATPVTTVELLLGKILAAAIPAVGATWLAFAVFLIGVRRLAAGPEVVGRIVQSHWLLAIFVVGPLLAVASVNIAVMISSRASDPRAAEQMSMFVLLPLLAVFVAQLAGLIYLDARLVVWMAIALTIVNVLLVAGAAKLFQREMILTRWK